MVPSEPGPTMITLHARNLRALRHFEWPISDVSVLTGANGAGKTTALLVLRTLRTAFDRGLAVAVSENLGGRYALRSHGAGIDAVIQLGLDIGDLRWRVNLVTVLNTGELSLEETLEKGDKMLFRRPDLGLLVYRGEPQLVSALAAEKLAVRNLAESYPQDEDLAAISEFLRSIHVFYDPDLPGLRNNGSRTTENRHLHSNGRNVLTMLRRWRDRRADNARFEFVHNGLLEAFPGVYSSLDFIDAGQTLTANVFRDGQEEATPIAQEANGLLSLMLLLAEVASAPDHGVVAIDEPEHALHPFAIRAFIRRTRAWARQHEVAVVLTTHSPVLLDAFQGEPERIFVLDRESAITPVRLDKMKNPDWIAEYTLGELYVNGEFAAKP